MNQLPGTREDYRNELSCLARLLTQEKEASGEEPTQQPEIRQQMRLFAAENLDKRFEKLADQMSFVAEAIPDMDDLLSEYIQEAPQTAYDTVVSDGDRFLRWLEHRPLTPEQGDSIRCQRARHTVESLARDQRLAYVRFQELWSLAKVLSGELGKNSSLRIHLNPIRVRDTFLTNTLLGEDADAPAEVVFFPVRGEIHTAALDAFGLEQLDRLAAVAPFTLDALQEVKVPVEWAELLEFWQDLAEMGLAAFG